jgi:hypothetical protein
MKYLQDKDDKKTARQGAAAVFQAAFAKQRAEAA